MLLRRNSLANKFLLIKGDYGHCKPDLNCRLILLVVIGIRLPQFRIGKWATHVSVHWNIIILLELFYLLAKVFVCHIIERTCMQTWIKMGKDVLGLSNREKIFFEVPQPCLAQFCIGILADVSVRWEAPRTLEFYYLLTKGLVCYFIYRTCMQTNLVEDFLDLSHCGNMISYSCSEEGWECV